MDTKIQMLYNLRIYTRVSRGRNYTDVFNIEDALLPFESLDNQFVYFGILFASFIMNMLIFVPIPIYPILVISVFDKKLDPNFIAMYSAIGIIIAKTIIFYLVYYGHNILFNRSRINKK
jgi:uncharacterized membrane protein YdjX (TVP38/TMEM64 family)